MKKFKHIIFLVIAFVFAFGIYKVTSVSQPTNLASGEMITNSPVLTYVTISMRDKVLTYDNLKVNNNSYIISANESVTVNFKPLEYSYNIRTTNLSNFSVKSHTIELDKLPSGNFPQYFEYKGTIYYYRVLVNSGNSLGIYYVDPATSAATPVVTSARSDLISYSETTDKFTIQIIESYTLKTDASPVDNIYEFPFEFGVFTTSQSVASQNFSLIFTKPAINFANASNPVVEFESIKNDGFNEVDNWLKPEQAYNTLSLTFLNEKYNYTENNPLYFNINYNGFVYTFTLFEKDTYLFVNYIDEDNPESNLIYLASAMINGGTTVTGEPILEIDPTRSISARDNFNMTFNYRGRYSIEIYDNTYLLENSNPNYYQTSFYIKDDTDAISSTFNNIYIISQTIDEENNPQDYIVNTSTQNCSVKSTVKNLLDSTSSFELKNIVKYLVVSTTLYGSSDNTTHFEYYVPSGSSYLEEANQIKASNPDLDITVIENLEEYLLENGDFVFDSTQDGYYQITVYEAASGSAANTINYSYTIVTQAKATFTIDGVTHEAEESFKTEIRDYTKVIKSSDPIRFDVSYGSSSKTSKTLDKTYVNNYSVIYGKQEVLITAAVGKDYITITCQGVGSLTVEITYDGETTPYYLNSEEGNDSITFYDYGSYTVKLVDSMGTTDTQTYNLSKKLNPSSLILIILSSVILLIVSTFVIISRASPKTR